MNKYIVKTIELLEQKRAVIDVTIPLLRRLIDPDEALPDGPAEVPEPAKKPRADKAGRNKGTTRSKYRTKSCQFKGVARVGRYKDGRARYQVKYYNSETRKEENLGCFGNQYLAAAAWFERVGDKERAAQLRDTARTKREGDAVDNQFNEAAEKDCARRAIAPIASIDR